MLGMQREMMQMASASHETYLKRMTEEWGAIPDAALFKELEMEKKRWMLSALHSINPTPKTGVAAIPRVHRRILAFFENHARNAGIPVHHMSPSPLSNKLFPNVAPLVHTNVPCMSFPVAAQTFSGIYAQSLPALVSSSDIPLVLRSMYRALKTRGTLHLILCEPAPVAATTGPRMRSWLDTYLLPNLERQYRCRQPRQAFPAWLQSAQFSVAESARVNCAFLAVVDDEKLQDRIRDRRETGRHGNRRQNREDELDKEECCEQQLRSLVGQQLWQEVWGPFVTADKWWWEDASCREECLQQGTTWEYQVVEAVKKGRPTTLMGQDVRYA